MFVSNNTTGLKLMYTTQYTSNTHYTCGMHVLLDSDWTRNDLGGFVFSDGGDEKRFIVEKII